MDGSYNIILQVIDVVNQRYLKDYLANGEKTKDKSIKNNTHSIEMKHDCNITITWLLLLDVIV